MRIISVAVMIIMMSEPLSFAQHRCSTRGSFLISPIWHNNTNHTVMSIQAKSSGKMESSTQSPLWVALNPLQKKILTPLMGAQPNELSLSHCLSTTVCPVEVSQWSENTCCSGSRGSNLSQICVCVWRSVNVQLTLAAGSATDFIGHSLHSSHGHSNNLL